MKEYLPAIRAQRSEPRNSLDDFPTPPWATRALIEHIIKEKNVRGLSCLEPACNRGYMTEALKQYFKSVTALDIHDYGYGKVANFLNSSHPQNSYDWVITNPPFNAAKDFVLRSLPIARKGVALLVRTGFLESKDRYNSIFNNFPPSVFAQFTERVPMLKGRLDKNKSTATSYGWLIWNKNQSAPTKLVWIPPCRKQLEKEGNYP